MGRTGTCAQVFKKIFRTVTASAGAKINFKCLKAAMEWVSMLMKHHTLHFAEDNITIIMCFVALHYGGYIKTPETGQRKALWSEVWTRHQKEQLHARPYVVWSWWVCGRSRFCRFGSLLRFGA